MVNEAAQLYTIEGVGAAILMVVTAYLVISSTTIFTPQDTHISDMQLQQLGSDALAMMDIADAYNGKSTLQLAIEGNNSQMFLQSFSRLVNSTTTAYDDGLKFNTMVYYRTDSSGIQPFKLCNNADYFRENAVTATRWVYITPPFDATLPFDNRDQVVLVEVLLWRN